MAPLRLRHPKGVTTLQIDFATATVLDLQQAIFSATEISPSQQDLKSGYPPQPLTLVPELPLDSLGLKAGEQLIVTQKSGPRAEHSVQSSTGKSASSRSSAANPPAAMTGLTASQRRSTPPSTASQSGRPTAAASATSQPAVPDHVLTRNGYLIHRIVPDDNSCLFSSIALIFEQDIKKAQEVRKIIAQEIRKNPTKWNDAILGRSSDDYISIILKPSAWGGAIELAILAEHYTTEIASVDVETGRVDTFDPPENVASGNRCIVIYSGIHYDATSVAPMLEAPPDFHQTIFPVESKGEEDEMLKAAKKLADALRAKKAYTNTATFDLKCQTCGQGLKGEKEARAHASETGHVDFGEY